MKDLVEYLSLFGNPISSSMSLMMSELPLVRVRFMMLSRWLPMEMKGSCPMSWWLWALISRSPDEGFLTNSEQYFASSTLGRWFTTVSRMAGRLWAVLSCLAIS
ncbi:MAG: hypothetical protein BWX71_01478 [Deltaproteobacteria bacterium ADurb.Bin072]|nr:MAG: hypothetical protein BWX71_01478 [Deltaproteobacteria bacterium ADurb.Bin072]